ncbi:hypothetical protein FACS1894189_0940 [Planctomycetales bacterium]|nr:hypothetical protein FACS1894189_0940 [Planctomycetales bacterium]
MIAILLLLLLDFQATRTADIPYSDFHITEIGEPATTGCATNPSNGTLNDVILIQVPYQLPDDVPFQWDTPRQDGFSNNTAERDEGSARTVRRMPFPSVAPPEPPQPPVAAPEPPTIAILTLTGLALLFLLFRQRIQRRL